MDYSSEYGNGLNYKMNKIMYKVEA